MHPTTSPQGDTQPDRPSHQPGDDRVPGIGVGEDVPGDPGERTQEVGRGAAALQLSPALGAEQTIQEATAAAVQQHDAAGDFLDRLKGGARRHPQNDPVAHQKTAYPPWSHQGKNRQRCQLENLLHHGGDRYGSGYIRRDDAGGAADP